MSAGDLRRRLVIDLEYAESRTDEIERDHAIVMQKHARQIAEVEERRASNQTQIEDLKLAIAALPNEIEREGS